MSLLDCLPYTIVILIFLGALIQCIKDTIKYTKCEPVKATVKNVVSRKDTNKRDYYLVDVDYRTEYGKYGSASLTLYGRYKIGETLDVRYDKDKDELLIMRHNLGVNIAISYIVMLFCIIKIIGVAKS